MDFYRRVGLVCAAIPKGRVATYGQIALLCGKPRNARQVGYALNRDLAGRDVPAHPDTQRKMLRAEGVRVSRDNRVDLKAFGWNNTLDEAHLLRAQFEEEGV